jgi:hypothetical protein
MGSMMLALLLAAAAAAPDAGAPAAPATAARVVEQVVAVVRNPAGSAARAVTLTRLLEETRIALVSRGAVEAAFRPLDAEALRAGLGWLLDETLVADEAARLRVDEVDRAALEAAVRDFQARFREPAEYRRFLAANEIQEEEVAAVLGRTLRAVRYLETRVGPGARVGDDEVERHLRAGGAGPATAAARDAARAELERGRARTQVRELLLELRARADVRILDPALRPAAEGA